jgi:hypothetical protein
MRGPRAGCRCEGDNGRGGSAGSELASRACVRACDRARARGAGEWSRPFLFFTGAAAIATTELDLDPQLRQQPQPHQPMLLQTNSYVVPKEKRNEHARLVQRFRQTLTRLGCDHFEVYEQTGANWQPVESAGNVRFVQIMRFRDRRHQQQVQAAERTDPTAQALIREFCELINFPFQQQEGLFAVGFYNSVVVAVGSAGAAPALPGAAADAGDAADAEGAERSDDVVSATAGEADAQTQDRDAQ